jgi:hypothetical protein
MAIDELFVDKSYCFKSTYFLKLNMFLRQTCSISLSLEFCCFSSLSLSPPFNLSSTPGIDLNSSILQGRLFKKQRTFFDFFVSFSPKFCEQFILGQTTIGDNL